jgi:hypothetical protein
MPSGWGAPISGTMVKISAAIPSGLRDNLEEHARANERSMSAEVRCALTEY